MTPDTWQATLDDLDGDGWNSWRAKPYVYEERLHPTVTNPRGTLDTARWFFRPSFLLWSPALSPYICSVSISLPVLPSRTPSVPPSGMGRAEG